MSANQLARHITVRGIDEGVDEDHSDAGETELRGRIRELVTDLVHEVLGAMAAASAREIGELIVSAGPSREPDSSSSRAHRAPGRADAQRSGAEAPSARGSRPARGRPSYRTEQRHVAGPAGSEHAHDTKSPPSHSDPFDITSPGELLASTGETSSRPRTQPLPSSDAVAGGPPNGAAVSSDAAAAAVADLTLAAPARRDLSAATPFVQPSPADSSTALVDSDREAASERRPTVVLRAGERLLSATGSGVVIRRERRIAPPR
jgi:hypothetical protein